MYTKKTYQQQYYLKNKERLKEKHKQWYTENRDSVLKQKQRYIEKNFLQKLITTSKRSAKEKNLEHSICITDFNVPTHCPYLNVELTTIQGNGRVQSNISIDRINSFKGYTPDNVQIISDLANRMKQNATKQQLITFAKSILEMYDTTID